MRSSTTASSCRCAESQRRRQSRAASGPPRKARGVTQNNRLTRTGDPNSLWSSVPAGMAGCRGTRSARASIEPRGSAAQASCHRSLRRPMAKRSAPDRTRRPFSTPARPRRLNRESGAKPELPRSGRWKRNPRSALVRSDWEAAETRRAARLRSTSPKTCRHVGSPSTSSRPLRRRSPIVDVPTRVTTSAGRMRHETARLTARRRRRRRSSPVVEPTVPARRSRSSDR